MQFKMVYFLIYSYYKGWFYSHVEQHILSLSYSQQWYFPLSHVSIAPHLHLATR